MGQFDLIQNSAFNIQNMYFFHFQITTLLHFQIFKLSRQQIVLVFQYFLILVRFRKHCLHLQHKANVVCRFWLNTHRIFLDLPAVLTQSRRLEKMVFLKDILLISSNQRFLHFLLCVCLWYRIENSLYDLQKLIIDQNRIQILLKIP